MVTEECIGCGSGGERLLGILHRSLRGTVPFEQLPDLSPDVYGGAGKGCSELYASSHAFFAVCPDILPNYPDAGPSGAWVVQSPNECVPCRKMWDHFGNAFDMFTIRGLHALKGAGDNYIRVVDSIEGIGFDNSEVVSTLPSPVQYSSVHPYCQLKL